MNVRTLIDSIVRQTVVLIAQLATSGGLRAPLAQVAEQVFLELARELDRQGVPRKVSADMFGMALRTYQRRTQRIAESATERGQSLWQAVFSYVRDGGLVTRDQVLHRFRHDDAGSLKGVLRDLVDSGLVFAAGRGSATSYRLATDAELTAMRAGADAASLSALAWSFVFREGPLGLERLCELSSLPAETLEPVLERLVDDGRIERVESAGSLTYRSANLVLGFDDPAGWEAAVLDHFTALVRTVGAKLALESRASAQDRVGGSTYHFALWHGHPLQDEVLDELSRFRDRSSALRARVDARAAERPSGARTLSVTAYYGQVVEQEEEEEEDAIRG